MVVPSWLRPLATRLHPTRTRRVPRGPAFRPRVEGLEDRVVPSVTVEEFPTLPNGISQPAEMQTAPDGSVWFSGASSGAPGAARNVLARISSYGEIQDFVVPFSMSNFVFGLDGNIWVGSNTSIHEVTPQGTVLHDYDIPSAHQVAGGALDIALGPDGNIWFTDDHSNQIGRITLQGQVNVFDIPTSNSRPVSIRTGPDNTLWFSETDANQIGKIVLGQPTTTGLGSSANPSVYGQPVTFTATVGAASGTPTGSVDFVDTTTNTDLGTVPLSGGTASVTTSALAAGSHAIEAIYEGAGFFLPSNGSVSQWVNVAAPTVGVVDVGGTYNGQPFAATAMVTGVSGTPGPSLEGVGLTLDYQRLNADGSVAADLGSVAPTAAGSYQVTASFAGSADYSGASASTTFSISPAPLTVTATGQDKTYDGTTAATVTLASNALSGDTLILSYGSASFADKNAGTGKLVTVGGISISGADAGNYTLLDTTTTTTADISPRELTVTATGVNKVYDGTTAATVSLSDNRVAGDLLTDGYTTATFDTSPAGTGKPVTVSGITISGPDAGNYTLVKTTAATTADITQAPTTTVLTVSAPTPLLGQSVTFTATVTATPGDFTGSVDFFDTTTQTDLGHVCLTNGSASLTTSTLAVGGHSIIATYSGDNNFQGSHSSATTLPTLTVLPPASLSGWVFEDFNADGKVDFGEGGIAGVTITLSGTDDLGNPVNLPPQQTDGSGYYSFSNLRPGSYTLTEAQPSAYQQGIDSVGTWQGTPVGSLTGTELFSLSWTAGDYARLGTAGINYNFGERPPAGSSVQKGQTATIGFWQNKNGQALIQALNGGSSSTQLAQWLVATLPDLYGSQAGSHSLVHSDGSYFSNAEVASFYLGLFSQTGPKLDAQVLATALSVYVTNATLDPTKVAASYGFTVSGDGVGAATWDIGSAGDAFGVANNTTMTVLDLLRATDAQAVNGLLYGGNGTRRSHANSVYSALNQAGDIG